MRTELNNGLVEPKLLSDSLDKCMMCAFHCRTCSTVLPSVTIFSPAHSRCFTLRRGRPKGGCEQRLPPHPRPSEAARPSAASRQSRAFSRLGPMRAQSTLQLPHRAGEEGLEKCLHTPPLHPSNLRMSRGHQAAEPTSRPPCLPRTLLSTRPCRNTNHRHKAHLRTSQKHAWRSAWAVELLLQVA